MKKKWMGGLLALALAALCMLPTQVQAASSSTTEKHMHGDVECKEWTDEMAVRYRGAGHTAKNSLPTGDSWNWYLTEDVTLTTRWYATFNSSGGDNVMDICLNGHTITFETTGLETNPQINRSFLTLCDCTGKGGIDLKGHNIYIASKCSLDVSDIYITGGSGDTSAVTVGYYGIFTMGDGTVIRDNTCTSEKAGGVTVEGRDSINRNNGVFIMNGGEIRRNTGGVGGVLNYGEFTINGGTIKENYGTTTGGVANSCDYKGMPEHDIPDNYGTMTIGGGAQVYGNHLRTTAGEASNLYLIDPENYPIHVSGLQSAAKIALNSWADGIVQGKVTDETLGCFSLDDPSLGVLYVENEQLKKLPAHYHCVCGAEHTVSGSHTAANLQTFTPWESEDSLPTEAGYYHLTKDVTLSETWKPKKGTVLCTNGHSIIAGGSFDIITVDSGVTFSLTDCSSEWSEYHNASALMPANAETYRGNGVRNDGTFNLYMGAIVGCVGTDGGGVYNNGTFNMYAGHIYRNGDQSGVGVVVEHGGGVLNNGTFNMYGGSIRNNGRESSVGSDVGVRYGGGVYVGTSGTFTMTGGDIMGNSVITGGQGSAIYVDDGGTLKLGKNVQIWNNNSASSIAFANDSANISIIRRLSDSAKIDIGSLSADRVTQTGNNFYTVENSRYLVSPGHIHKPDGTEDPNGNDETEAIYKKWTSTDSLPTTAGAWRLMNDVTVSSGTVLNEDVTLCLNGHTITVKDGADYTYYVTRSHILNIVDCQGSGVINGGSTAASKRAGVKVESYGTFNLYDGTIKGFGSGVAVQKSATFKMYGGAISGNHSDSAGGGVAVQKDGSFEMYGGSIAGNSAATYGGGVCNTNGSVKLAGGTISGNTAGTQGGGIYNDSEGSVSSNSYAGLLLYPTRGGYKITVTGNTVGGAANNLATAQTIMLSREWSNYYSPTLRSTGSTIGMTVLEPANGKDVVEAYRGSSGGYYNAGDLSRDLPRFTLDDNKDGQMELTTWDGAFVIQLTVYHKHSICNLDSASHDISVAGHSGECGGEIDFKEWTDYEAQKDYGSRTFASGIRVKATNWLPRTGNWYLSKDVTLEEKWEANNEDVTLNLCFNGHTVTSDKSNTSSSLLRVCSGASANLTDCAATPGGLRGNSALTAQRGLQVSWGYVNLYNGTITGFTSTYGAGVSVEPRSSGSFGLYGNAAIQYNKSTNTGDLKFGGYYPNSELEKVSDRDTAGGGGVANYGKFTMNSLRSDAIAYNSAARYGGGLFNWPYGDTYRWAKLLNGGITGNTAGEQGGGVLTSHNPNDTALTLGGSVSITGNTLTDDTDDNLYLVTDTKNGSVAKICVSGLTENADIQVVEVEGRGGKDYFSGVTYETLPPEVLARITTNNGSIFAWNEAHDTILLVQAVPADLMPVVAAETTLTYSGEEQTVLTVPEGADTYYTVSGEEKATDVGEYTITLRLNEGYVWPDGTETDKTIQWKIQPMKVKAPAAVTGLIYNGETKTGVAAGEGYTLEGEAKAINAGEHTAAAKLTNTANYQWDDGTTEDKTIVWSIGEKTPVVSDFAVTYPRSEDLVYDGNAKEVTAELSDSYPTQDITLTVVYTNADGIAVEEPTNAGTYTVKLCVSGSSNFAAAELALDDLTIVPMGQELSFAEARVDLTYDPASTSYTQTASGAKGPVVYRGSDDTVAAVDAATGEVTIRKAGTVVITAMSDDSNHNYAQSSATYTLVIQKAAQDAPAGLEGTAPSSIGGTDGTITGVTSAMEYSADGVNYVTCPDGTLAGLNSGSYQVRFKETDTHRAGAVLDVTVPVHQHTFDQKAESQQYRKADATCLSPALYYKSCACGVSSEGTAGEAIFEVGQKLEHDFQWKDYDNDYHVKQCRNGCDEWDMTTREAHIYDGLEGTECLTCGHDRTVNYFTVSFEANEAEYGMVTPVQAVSRVPEGADLTVSGSTVTVKGVTVAAVASANTAQYTYAFEKWSTPNGTYTVTDDTTITAIFSRTINQYTVAWNAQGGSLTGSCTDGTVDYGTAIQAPGADKETDEDNSYVFLGWSTTPNGAVEDVAETVTGNVTYYAQYEVQPHVWTEDWNSDDTYHWHTCTVDGCGYTKDKAEHDYTDADDTTCDTCGYQRTLPDITGTVVINGKLERGETLTAETSGMPNADLRYQWLRNGQPIEGADEAAYELTGEDIGKTISVRITAKGYAGTIETEAEGTVTVYYSVSYDTEVGGTLAMDRAEGGKNYTLRSDWDSMGFRAPDKKTFDKWIIDGVAYEAGTTYVVEHDVSVTPLWKDVKSDDDDGPKPPVPTPDDPVKPPVPAPDDKWHNHKGNGTNNGADGAAQSPKTFDAGIAAYAAAAVLSLSGAAGLRRRKRSGK